MVKKVALSLGALALAFGGSVLVAPAAHAGTSSASIPGAKATFDPNGEIFKLSDTECDDNPVYLRYSLRGGSENRHDLASGCNSSITYDKEFIEGSRVDYRVCVNRRALPDKCSGWTTDYA
jgi:hypothetical protein